MFPPKPKHLKRRIYYGFPHYDRARCSRSGLAAIGRVARAIRCGKRAVYRHLAHAARLLFFYRWPITIVNLASALVVLWETIDPTNNTAHAIGYQVHPICAVGCLLAVLLLHKFD